MNEKELLGQLVAETDKMLSLQRKYFGIPKDSADKYPALMESKAQEKKVRQMIKDYYEEQKRKLEPSLFGD